MLNGQCGKIMGVTTDAKNQLRYCVELSHMDWPDGVHVIL